MLENLSLLPDGLPVPLDDGACSHLLGLYMPGICLLSTTGDEVYLAELKQRVVLYCYPFTGRPDIQLPEGWNQIPGARGCTAEACAFRDHYHELQALGVEVFGLSTQDTGYQQEVVERLHIPFRLLSDSRLVFTEALSLPTFEAAGMTLLKRFSMVVDSKGKIEKVFYPVFPPDKHPDEINAWLAANPVSLG